MDLDQAKTFLAIAETGSFVDAAGRLNITQSTVSARIKNLEYLFGQPLFTRGRAGAKLTPAGEQFKRHAATIVRTWDHARQESGLPDTFTALLKVGGQYSFWDNILLDWVGSMRNNHPSIALRADGGSSEALVQQLSDGLLDFGVMYSPQYKSGLTVEKLFEETLLAVSSLKDSPVIGGSDYIFVEWGDLFRASHAESFPEVVTPGLTDGMGPLALDLMLRHGGTGYFPLRMVKPYLESQKLKLVPDAPVYQRPAYVVYPEDSGNEAIGVALVELRKITSAIWRQTVPDRQ